MSDNNKTIEINCIYTSDNNQEQQFAKISYRNGTFINFETNDYNLLINKHENFLCTSTDNEIMLLWNNQYFERQISIFAGFDCLIKGFKTKKQTQNLKFKKINFVFPYINEFFIGIDNIETFDKNNPKEIFLKYIKTKKKIKIKLNDNFTMELIHGVSWGGGSLGGENAKMSLNKNIQLTAKRQTSIDDFLHIMRDLISFFSLGLKQKLPITDVYSEEKNNTAKCTLKIIPFQYKIQKENNDDKGMVFHKALYTYPHLQNCFEKVVTKYLKLREKDYKDFSVIVDLYLRNHDVQDEIYPQIKYLIYAQALEAYLNSKSYNNKKTVSSEYVSLLRNLKKDYPDIKEIQELKQNALYSFKEKLMNSSRENNIFDVVQLKHKNKEKIKLFEDLVNVRNYYTHYSISSSDKRLKDIDLYELMESTKALLETFILKDLEFDAQMIHNILANNYFKLRNFNSKYIWINNAPKFRNVNADNYLGDDFRNAIKDFAAMYYFYEEIGDKVKLILKYRKYDIYTRKGSTKLKTFTKTKLVNKNLSTNDIAKLPEYFKVCFTRYKDIAKQKSFK